MSVKPRSNNPYDGYYTGSVRASEPIVLTTDDATPSAQPRGVWVSAAGTIVGRLVDDNADSTWLHVPVGFFKACFSVVRKASSGTTATLDNFCY
jgi:hypothetical protein